MADGPDAFPDVPDLSGLPGWAQLLGYLVFAGGVGVLGLVGRYGWLMARREPAPEKAAEVAAVIVDPEALNRLTAAGLKLEATIGRATDVLAQLVADGREERQEREIDEEVTRRVDAQLRERRTRQRRAARAKTGT